MEGDHLQMHMIPEIQVHSPARCQAKTRNTAEGKARVVFAEHCGEGLLFSGGSAVQVTRRI